MRHTHAAPAAGNRHKNIRLFGNEVSLLVGGKHQVAETLSLRRERREDSSADAEIRRTHMRALFGSFEAEGDSAKVCGVHDRTPF